MADCMFDEQAPEEAARYLKNFSQVTRRADDFAWAPLMPHAGASHLVEAAAESDKGRRPPIFPATKTRAQMPKWKNISKILKNVSQAQGLCRRKKNATPDFINLSVREADEMTQDTSSSR